MPILVAPASHCALPATCSSPSNARPGPPLTPRRPNPAFPELILWVLEEPLGYRKARLHQSKRISNEGTSCRMPARSLSTSNLPSSSACPT